MLSYCFKSRRNTGNENQKVLKMKIRRIMLLSKCAKCDSKKNEIY